MKCKNINQRTEIRGVIYKGKCCISLKLHKCIECSLAKYKSSLIFWLLIGKYLKLPKDIVVKNWKDLLGQLLL
jgi:hypothetical protein